MDFNGKKLSTVHKRIKHLKMLYTCSNDVFKYTSLPSSPQITFDILWSDLEGGQPVPFWRFFFPHPLAVIVHGLAWETFHQWNLETFLLVTFPFLGNRVKERPVKGTSCQGLVPFHVCIHSFCHSSQERNKSTIFLDAHSLNATLIPNDGFQTGFQRPLFACLLHFQPWEPLWVQRVKKEHSCILLTL